MAELRGNFVPSKLDFKDSFFKSTTIEDASGDGGRRQLREHTARRARFFDRIFGGDNGKPAKPIRMSAGQTKQKKYRPITRKERKFPLWTSIHAINGMLSKFASKHDRVTFFDSTGKCGCCH
jgi:hypothetical protein